MIVGMRRFLFWWMALTQLPCLFALWIAKDIAVIAAAATPPGLTESWPLIAWTGFAVYVILVLGLIVASWRCVRHEEEQVAGILTTLLIPATLPILAYAIVRFFAVR